MKNLIAILTASAVLALGAQQARAHDGGWATTGKILTGLVIGGAVATALQPPPPPVVYAPPPVVYTPAPAVTYAPAPVVAAPPVYVQPAPVVVYSAPVYAPYRYYYGGPVVTFRFGYGGGYYHRHGWH